MSWNDVNRIVEGLNQCERVRRTDYYTTLPTPEEWQRAGRGADGRPYPWGWHAEFAFSQNYRTATDDREQLLPEEFPAEDVSPIGVRELAGSVRELCLPSDSLLSIGTKQYVVCGGSHYSYQLDDLSLSSMRPMLHLPSTAGTGMTGNDIGVRLVRRRRLPPPTGPTRADILRDPPDDWRLLAVRDPFREELPFGRHAARVDGGFELRGFGGNFSPQLLFWRGVRAEAGASTIKARWRHTFDGELSDDRGVRNQLGLTPRYAHTDSRVTVIVPRRQQQLRCVHDGAVTAEVETAAAFEPGTPVAVEFELLESEFVCRLRLGEHAEELRAPLGEATPRRWNYLAIVVPNYNRTVVQLERLQLEER